MEYLTADEVRALQIIHWAKSGRVWVSVAEVMWAESVYGGSL